MHAAIIQKRKLRDAVVLVMLQRHLAVQLQTVLHATVHQPVLQRQSKWRQRRLKACGSARHAEMKARNGWADVLRAVSGIPWLKRPL